MEGEKENIERARIDRLLTTHFDEQPIFEQSIYQPAPADISYSRIHMATRGVLLKQLQVRRQLAACSRIGQIKV